MRPIARVPSYAVPALEKGLDLLEALAARPGDRSQADLARDLGRSASEIFRMLNCLERRGYIVKDAATGRYRLTLRLYELAHTHTPVDQLLHAAEGPLRDLARRIRESAHLSVLSDGKLVVLSQVESQNRTRVSVEIGGRFPAVLTASGRILLAHLGQDELKAFLARDEDWGRLAAAARERFLADLLRIRRDGVYQGKSDLTQGIRDVAAYVGNPRIGISAAVCVPSLIAIGKPKPLPEIRAAVKECAGAITRQLGLRVT
ncbi:MAG: IclR family transcriptional regulator [Planctomycetaceae bacterium]|nr:IclR family transcriptional regulator [Planctomycetaceae bacterium]